MEEPDVDYECMSQLFRQTCVRLHQLPLITHSVMAYIRGHLDQRHQAFKINTTVLNASWDI